MDTAKKKDADLYREKESSPSPEPFKEPDGMVTIELDRHTPSPSLQSSLNRTKQDKKKNVKYILYSSVITVLCILSFVAAVTLHWNDIAWLAKKLENFNDTTYYSAEPLQVTSPSNGIEMETCPVDPQEEYSIHLIMCEKTKTFKDCCHRHIRSRLSQINDVCSLLEMLDLLVEYKRIHLRRTARNTDIEYGVQDYKKEEEMKTKDKVRTKEKILSYIRHLNKPLQREIPALFDWFGELFSEYEEEFENNNEDKNLTENGHHEDNTTYGTSPETLEENNVPDYMEPRMNGNEITTSTATDETDRPISTEKEDEKEEENNQTLIENSFKLSNIQNEEVNFNGTTTFEPQVMTTEQSKQEIPYASDEMSTPNDDVNENETELNKTNRRKRNQPYFSGNDPFSPYQSDGYGVDNAYQQNNNMDMNQNDLENFDEMQNYDNRGYENFDEQYPAVGLAPHIQKEENSGYQSLINQEPREDELRLPVHTEERDFGRHTWKDFNNYKFDQRVTAPQEPTANFQEFFMKNGQVTYSYLETPPPTTEGNYNQDDNSYSTEDSSSLNKKSSGQDGRINDKMMRLPPSEAAPHTLKPVQSVRNFFDATDSIESIENIRSNNEGVSIEIGKTKIIVSKADEESKKTSTEINEQLNNIEESTTIKEDLRETQEKNMRKVENIKAEGVVNFRSAAQQAKGSSFQLVNEDTQSSQNLLMNPSLCQYQQALGSPNKFMITPENHPQLISMVPQMSVPKPPVYVINPSMISYFPPSPVIPHYGPVPQQYNPYTLINPLSTAPMSSMATGTVQMANSNGQVFLCNPTLPTSNIPSSNTQAVEIRSSSNLQESFDRIPLEVRTSNKSRASLNCPINEQSCLDASKCISVRHVCDNEVHCEDGSDETFCSCRERIAEIRLCDGYFDCPDGEDERGCFGCSEDEINCDDWSRFKKGTCVPMSQRCDGVRQCEVTGKDEDDCSILTDHIGENNPMKISNAAGFLHRNYKGKWYPTCFGSEIWAMEVCKVEAGPSTIAPMSHLMPATEKYEGQYINLLPNREVTFVSTCVPERASFVECPPLFCGLRMTIRNPYRAQEVDTSIEDMMNHLNRQDITFGDDFDMERKTSHNRTKRFDDFILGGERVVGGRASQPAAWPWVVSIYKNGIFHCGGVIINELWVLTAAHCVDKYWLFYYEIQAGILRRFSYSPMEQVRWIVATIAHEDYDKSNLKNDIALMKLSSAVRYNRYVRPICLPSETTAGSDFRRGPLPGTICTTVGWGATMEHGADPDHMREVEVPVLKSCKHQEDIEGQELCAGLFEGGKDACQGDSGGPFMCQNPNNPSQWYLAGIVSHGEGCARPNEPGVYTRVSQYMDWIADNIREGNFFSRTPLQKCPGYVCRGTNKCIPRKRHCDKVVDCLMGDDEMNCENRFQNIFKFSGDPFMPLSRSANTLNTEEPTGNNETGDDILGAVIIDSETENSTRPSITKDEKPLEKNITRVIYYYEKKEYFTNNTNHPEYFRCESLLQMIPIRKRCNRIVDCEDGTDEKGCKCVDYLKLSHPNSICDGVIDCKDASDETVCFSCREGEFNCVRSMMCISENLVCDGKRDCTKGEDELDCVALTDGETLILDSVNRPNMSLAGIVTVNSFGVWKPYCNTSESKADATVATNICNYLGFGEYTGFNKVKVVDRSLSVQNLKGEYMISRRNVTTNVSSTCDGLYVWCSYVNSDTSIQIFRKDRVYMNETNEAIWNAAIFSDGIYKCMGVILNEKWVLTSINCFDGILQSNIKYLAVIVGKGMRYFDVPGPNDQISNVAESYQILESDIVVLRLEKPIEFNRYIQPTHLHMRTDKERKEKCLAVGLKEGRTSLVFLETKPHCSKESSCYSAVPQESCLNGPWSGVITCYAGNGWYPASVFSTMGKSCPFQNDTNFTSVRFWGPEIKKYADIRKTVHQKSFCDGFRCDLGNCIDVDELCDGIPQCLYGEDETPFFCVKKKNACPILKNCKCPSDHLRCLNGKCVHKSKFCDRVNDCGDFSDEPPRCTCRSYLKLSHPEKVCDGHVNCIDGTDENPKMCQCRENDFVCSESKFCVSEELVCNGFADCPHGEDEKQCFALDKNVRSHGKSGEVLTRRAGQVFESCFLDSPPTPELDNICRHLGFVSSKSHHLEPYSEKGNVSVVPVMDTFNVVWIRREGRVPLLFRMRTGNDAYLTFRKQDNCHRLHIECI